MTKQFAVIGNPIEQSRSPELHHAFAAKTGVNLDYKKILAPLESNENIVVPYPSLLQNRGALGLYFGITYSL